MTGYGNVMPCSAMAALVLLSAGCAHRIQLRSPRDLDSVEVGSAASPRFAWRSSYRSARPGDHHEYSLVVARDPAFRDIALRKDRVDSHTFVLEAEDGWLPGATEYFWKVDGVVRDESGEERTRLSCENPRSFMLERRRTVRVDLTVPEGFEARVGGSEREFFRGIISDEFENGERREVVLRSSDGEVVVSGHIQVVAVSDDTRYDKIAVNNIRPAEIESIARGDVGTYHYELGGRRIVEVKLGGRSRSRTREE